MEKQKNFRAFQARKALMTLRLEQCHQNWLTILAESKGFEPLWRCRLTVFKTAPL